MLPLLISHWLKHTPIYLFIFMSIHKLNQLPNWNWFLSDLNPKSLGKNILVLRVHPKAAMFEHLIHILLLEHDVWSYIILSMIVNLFENCWILECDNLFGFNCFEIFVAFHFLNFVRTQAIKATEIGINELFADWLWFYFV